MEGNFGLQVFKKGLSNSRKYGPLRQLLTLATGEAILGNQNPSSSKLQNPFKLLLCATTHKKFEL